jgi:hypothetical protein
VTTYYPPDAWGFDLKAIRRMTALAVRRAFESASLRGLGTVTRERYENLAFDTIVRMLQTREPAPPDGWPPAQEWLIRGAFFALKREQRKQLVGVPRIPPHYRAAVQDTLWSLDERERKFIEAFVKHGAHNGKVAAHLGIHPKSVSRTLHRTARRILAAWPPGREPATEKIVIDAFRDMAVDHANPGASVEFTPWDPDWLGGYATDITGKPIGFIHQAKRKTSERSYD